jgi:hypothetical protein
MLSANPYIRTVINNTRIYIDYKSVFNINKDIDNEEP